MSLFSISAGAFLPILVTGAAGFLPGRVHDVDPEPLNTATMYVLALVLVFYSLATAELTGETLVTLTASVVAYHVAMFLVAGGVVRFVGISDPLLGAFAPVTALPNSGDYGIFVSSFALGDTGRLTAAVYLTVQNVPICILGVYIAGRGDDRDDAPPGWHIGLEHIVRIPLVYAVVAALTARWLGVVPSTGVPVMEMLRLVGDSLTPMMPLILDIQLAGADLDLTFSGVGVVAALKMAVAPAVTVGITLVASFGDPTVTRTFVLEPVMPAAITPLILIAEFGGTSRAGSAALLTKFVSAAAFATTLLNVPALSVLIYLLNHGLVM